MEPQIKDDLSTYKIQVERVKSDFYEHQRVHLGLKRLGVINMVGIVQDLKNRVNELENLLLFDKKGRGLCQERT